MLVAIDGIVFDSNEHDLIIGLNKTDYEYFQKETSPKWKEESVIGILGCHREGRYTPKQWDEKMEKYNNAIQSHINRLIEKKMKKS